MPGLAFTLYVTVCVYNHTLHAKKTNLVFGQWVCPQGLFGNVTQEGKLKFHTQILDINIYSAIGAIMQGQIWRSNKNR